MAIEVTEDYRSLLVAVKLRIRAAQYEALKAVNRDLMALYWEKVQFSWLAKLKPHQLSIQCLVGNRR